MKTVYAYMCVDILHEGHIVHLEHAKAQGDRLIVGVLTDKAVMERKTEPILNFQQRLRIVKALKCVDAVIPQDEYSPVKNVLAMQPDVMMQSESHMGEPYLEELQQKFKGRIVMDPYYPEESSTGIKKKILERWKKE